MAHVTRHMLHVTCYMSHVTNNIFCFYKVIKLVAWGSGYFIHLVKKFFFKWSTLLNFFLSSIVTLDTSNEFPWCAECKAKTPAFFFWKYLEKTTNPFGMWILILPQDLKLRYPHIKKKIMSSWFRQLMLLILPQRTILHELYQIWCNRAILRTLLSSITRLGESSFFIFNKLPNSKS